MWLPVRVLCRRAGGEWTEQTHMQDVTTLGGRFTLSRPVEWGQLLHLTMEMPKQLRLYDLDQREYGVWAVVRHVRPYKLLGASRPQATQYQIGVAFGGRDAPASFLEDPSTLYDISPPQNKEEMWLLSEIREEEEDAPAEEPSSREDDRAEERLLIPYEIRLEFLNSKGEVSALEETLARNISPRGASVPTTVKAPNGSYVRLSIPDEGFTVVAVVRDQTLDADGVSRLHLEFIDGVWQGGRRGGGA